MGYSISAKQINGSGEASFFHYPNKTTPDQRFLHHVLNVPNIKDNKDVIKTYSKGSILEAMSKLIKISNTQDEQQFLHDVLDEIRVNGSKEHITITFN